MFAVEGKRKGRACIVIEVAVAAAVLNLVIIGLDLTSYLDYLLRLIKY